MGRRRLEGVEWRLDDGKDEKKRKGDGRMGDGCAGLGALAALTAMPHKKNNSGIL